VTPSSRYERHRGKRAGLDAGIAQAQGRGRLSLFVAGGQHDPLERRRVGRAGAGFELSGEQALVDLLPDANKRLPVGLRDQPADANVAGVVDRRLRAQGAPSPRLITRVQKRPGVVAITLRPKTIATWSGPAEAELVADRLLEPVAARLRTIGDARVGELELTDGELVAEASLRVFVAEGVRQRALPAAEEGPDVPRREARADGAEHLRVGAGAKAVVERLEGDPGLLGLAPRPFVSGQAEPAVVGRVAEHLRKARLHWRSRT
jgi:hypothetical protein